MDSDKLTRLSARMRLLALFAPVVILRAQSSGSLTTRKGSGGGGSNAYDVTLTYPGPIANLFTFPLITFPRAVNWAANLAGSTGAVGTNPTATATFNLAKNGSGIGTVVISTSGVFSFTTSSGSPVSFSTGDVLQIETPATDATLTSVTMTFLGSL